MLSTLLRTPFKAVNVEGKNVVEQLAIHIWLVKYLLPDNKNQ